MTIRKAILPAAGLGTRLRPTTHFLPKELLPLGEKSVLQRVLEECDAAGLDQLLVVLNPQKTAIVAVADALSGEMDPVTRVPTRSVYFVSQRVRGGLAHAVLHGEAFVGNEPFAVALADTVVYGGEMPVLSRLIRAHLEHGAVATVAAEEVPLERVSRYGIFALADAEGSIPGGRGSEVFRVREIVEKPLPEVAPSRLAISARYVFNPEIFAACRAAPRAPNGEIELTRAMTWLAGQGRLVLGVRLAPGERRLDIGSPESYFAAFRELQQANREPQESNR
ncbi:MAG: NTP transferase domain-containing protein [Armatimonadetes bacterium]|nr:NTP transferase domain-containing protein [Armatimonadota bacterium]